MTHISQRYFDKHGHFPRVEAISGVQRITVEFCPGYVIIRSSSPYQAQVYVTRSAFLTLLRKVLPLAKRWAKESHPDHDVPAAMRESYQNEMAILQEKRALKKSFVRDPEAQSHRQRQRFLKARQRSEPLSSD